MASLRLELGIWRKILQFYLGNLHLALYMRKLSFVLNHYLLWGGWKVWKRARNPSPATAIWAKRKVSMCAGEPATLAGKR